MGGARAIPGAIPEAPVLQLAALPLLGENEEVTEHYGYVDTD
jgi:hypothetical protein